MTPEPEDDPYPPLFESYRRELRALYERLNGQNDAAVRRFMDEEGLDEASARERLEGMNGPLVHDGRVIHVIRKYWLEIDRLKKERMDLPDDPGFLEPLTFLVEDLAEAGDGELVAFLTRIAYWPIGLDENNEWS
jgi:hypothetical protein